jgi:hypothetical protein
MTRERFAWTLLKHRAHMVPALLRHPHRDVVGQLLANTVSCARLFVAMLGRPIPDSTEIERRAVVNSRKRLLAKVRAER